MEILQRGKHISSILIFLLERGEVKKTDLSRVVSSPQTYQRAVKELEKEGYVVQRETIIGRRIVNVSLTPKGRSVAEQLKRAEEAAKGVVIHEDESRIEVSDIPEMWREKWKNLHALIHVNVFDDHVTIMETNHEGSGKERIFNIYVRENGQGHLRLWCELDESFDCYHVGYALTLAPVQDMFARVRGGK